MTIGFRGAHNGLREKRSLFTLSPNSSSAESFWAVLSIRRLVDVLSVF